MPRTTSGTGENTPLREAPVPRAREDLAIVEDDGAAAERLARRARDLLAFPEVVVDVHEGRLRREDVLTGGVEDHDVGVGAGRQRALVRVDAEDLRERGRGPL